MICDARFKLDPSFRWGDGYMGLRRDHLATRGREKNVDMPKFIPLLSVGDRVFR